ncbi:MAG: hypothetical protein D4R67_06740 [Bacteroidetes bacterium]|nr:MAG: hypothetical protein D4R67_06740 [Bacteroidota bacterium]
MERWPSDINRPTDTFSPDAGLMETDTILIKVFIAYDLMQFEYILERQSRILYAIHRKNRTANGRI